MRGLCLQLPPAIHWQAASQAVQQCCCSTAGAASASAGSSSSSSSRWGCCSSASGGRSRGSCGAASGSCSSGLPCTLRPSLCPQLPPAPHHAAGVCWAGERRGFASSRSGGGRRRDVGSRRRVRAAAQDAARIGTATSTPLGGRSDSDGASGSGTPAPQPAPQERQPQPPPAQQPKAQSQAAAPPSAPPSPPPRYSPLHVNIEHFCRRVVPSPEERDAKARLIAGVRSATRRAFDGDSLVVVEPFGSFVSGTSTWDSDVDLVVTGVADPSRVSGFFSGGDRVYVIKCLDRVANQLRRNKKMGIRKLAIIRGARIPIIKLATHTGLHADISIGDGSGPRAARYIAQKAAEYPPLAPLVLVLKVYLRSCGLNEVATGGLSSFSLVNMVLAHLQEELKAGYDIFDLGEALYGCLLRYGHDFDFENDAVSVAAGGIVPKAALGFSLDTARWGPGGSGLAPSAGGYLGSASARLCVDDPLTGRDVSAGTYRIPDIQAAMRKAAQRLAALARARPPGLTNLGVNYLEALFDVGRALRRPGPAEVVEADARFFAAGRRAAGRLLSGDELEEISLDDFDDDELYDGEGGGGGGSSRQRPGTGRR